MKNKLIIGNLVVITTKENNEQTKVEIYNGSDCVYSKIYTCVTDQAIESSLKELDIYTADYVYSVFTERYSKNTYSLGKSLSADNKKQTWFCRIDDTGYFKKFVKEEKDFIKDKTGKRIIDR